jgi:TRAP-type C4-dicarboxylate transport system permease large subunit
MIVYAYMARSSVSVFALFLAGVVPGTVFTLGMIVIIRIIAKRRGYPRRTWRPLYLRGSQAGVCPPS